MTEPHDPTPLDLFRLGVFATLNGGELPDVSQRVYETYCRLKLAGLVTIDHDAENYPHLPARITPKGQAVVEAMATAGRKELSQ